MSIQDRVEDADFSGRTKRREEALLSVLVAVAATARKTFPQITGDQAKLEAFMKTRTRLDRQYRVPRTPVDLGPPISQMASGRTRPHHTARLPVDLRIVDGFSDPNSCSVRAGAPEHTVLLSPGWYHFLTRAVLHGQR